jgi:uncharacterized protein YqjF (DUF2071 family)
MKTPFLTARWTNLALITYRLNPAMLQPFVPPGCVLDLKDGSAFVSLVAFDFVDTRVLGIPWPGFIKFPEINLRFYVRYADQSGEHRGVCFIREFVAKKTVARLANWLYNESYLVAPMTSSVTHHSETITVRHRLSVDGRDNTVEMIGSKQTICPPCDSTECFFKEHEWGFGTSRSNRLIRYKVTHPVWNIHPVQSFKIDWDWNAVYGPHWASLQDMEPISVILAEGSAVKVFPYGTPKIPPGLAASAASACR